MAKKFVVEPVISVGKGKKFKRRRYTATATRETDYASDSDEARMARIEARFGQVIEIALYAAAEELTEIYQKGMNQYYKYKTLSYVRHWEKKKGTKKGTNLKYSGQFHAMGAGIESSLSYVIDSGEMAEYRHISRSEVLETVLHGHRNVGYHARKKYSEYIPWNFKYSDRYYKSVGDMYHSFVLDIGASNESFNKFLMPFIADAIHKKI